MDSEPTLAALVAPLREDVVSGATTLSGLAARIVGRAALELPARTAGELGDVLLALGRRILAAQPAMAPLVALLRDVLGAAAAADTLEAARTSAAEAAASFVRARAEATAAIARHAQALLPDGARVATISSSGSVLAALLLAARTSTVRVVCFEARPMNEGRALAQALAEAGLEVQLAVDAAIGRLVTATDLLLIGADSIGDAGVVNKIGSAAAVLAAREAGVAAHVLADSAKLLPHGWPQPLGDDRPPDEVWRAPPGVRVWNNYFEAVPAERLDGFVTEHGAVGVDALRELRRGIVAPPALRGS